MSDKKKYPRREAMEVAGFLCSRLKDHCERLVVAGSLRRGKREAGDIEILYVPLMKADAPSDFFAAPPLRNEADYWINNWRTAELIVPRPNINGHIAWGDKNKLAIHKASGIPVDFFATTQENWWVSLVIRTGGKDTNLLLTTGAQKMNRKLHAYGKGVELLSTGEMLIPESEQDVFKFCGVEYKEPKDRV